MLRHLIKGDVVLDVAVAAYEKMSDEERRCVGHGYDRLCEST